MFGGIVAGIGIVTEVVRAKEGDIDSGRTITISTKLNTSDLKIGDSVCVSGCCLTLTKKDGNSMQFFAIQDTLKVTTLMMLGVNSYVNLEFSLRVGDPIGGHIVTGHVDEVCKIVGIEDLGKYKRLQIEISKYGSEYVVQKGSIAINGVSLTIAYAARNIVAVNIIPHTWENTNIKLLNDTINCFVNVEFDQTAKYLHKIAKKYFTR